MYTAFTFYFYFNKIACTKRFSNIKPIQESTRNVYHNVWHYFNSPLWFSNSHSPLTLPIISPFLLRFSPTSSSLCLSSTSSPSLPNIYWSIYFPRPYTIFFQHPHRTFLHCLKSSPRSVHLTLSIYPSSFPVSPPVNSSTLSSSFLI